jgi:hypothetical protein
MLTFDQYKIMAIPFMEQFECKIWNYLKSFFLNRDILIMIDIFSLGFGVLFSESYHLFYLFKYYKYIYKQD